MLDETQAIWTARSQIHPIFILISIDSTLKTTVALSYIDFIVGSSIKKDTWVIK